MKLPDEMRERSPYILEMLKVRKAYGPVQALKGVTLQVRRGTIHAVLGENGAGKSTLIEILAGNVAPDGGLIRINGSPVSIADAGTARRWGVAVVHQHLSLAPTVSVAENLYAGRLPGGAGFVDSSALYLNTKSVLERYNIAVDPKAIAGDLPLGLQQQIEIARALSGEAQVLALDEPTSSLSLRESRALFEQLRRLRAMGTTIILITHRVDDALNLADRGTALRDGEWVGDYEASTASESGIIEMMIGRPLTQVYPEKRNAASPTSSVSMLRVERLQSGFVVKDATLHVAAGEIVGLYGLVGAGRSELAQCLFGLRHRDSGTVFVAEHALSENHGPREALRAGLAFLPEDRNSEGLFPARSIADNVCAPRLAKFGRLLLSSKDMQVEAERAVAQFSIRGRPDTPVERLSGGNQQKVLFARWRATFPRVLIADEPTRGVDIGTKAEIHNALRDLATSGTAVLLISSEMPEILGMSDRIYVMAGGRVVDDCSGSDATERRLMLSCSPNEKRDRENVAS